MLSSTVLQAGNLLGSSGASFPRARHIIYENYDVEKAPIYNVSQDRTSYFVTSDKYKCLLEGTLTINQDKGCECRKGYFGPWCSFPEPLRTATIPVDAIRPRKVPRKVIYGTPFNNEFEMLEARVAELGDVVDLFLVTESSYSGYGDEKPLRLLERLKKGYLAEIQHKLSYVHLGYFPQEAKADGWIADTLYRNILGTQGLMHQVTGYSDEDLFIITDTDELPTRQALLFFKLHEGFAEPFGFFLHRTVFGFFWRFGEGAWKVFAGCTMGMVRNVFDFRVSKIRTPGIHLPHLGAALESYKKPVNPWILGEHGSNFVGWHCTWCTDIAGMQVKLASAINADFPRWGDYPEKYDKKYLRGLVKNGRWFDDKSGLEKVPASFQGVAPMSILNNKSKYRHLLFNNFTDEVTD